MILQKKFLELVRDKIFNDVNTLTTNVSGVE
jgi:hypothetical protein